MLAEETAAKGAASLPSRRKNACMQALCVRRRTGPWSRKTAFVFRRTFGFGRCVRSGTLFEECIKRRKGEVLRANGEFHLILFQSGARIALRSCLVSGGSRAFGHRNCPEVHPGFGRLPFRGHRLRKEQMRLPFLYPFFLCRRSRTSRATMFMPSTRKMRTMAVPYCRGLVLSISVPAVAST